MPRLARQRIIPVLVLTRKPRESIRIGEDIVVTLISVDRNQVRIGVSAPRDVPVHREEIAQRIERDQALTGLVT